MIFELISAIYGWHKERTWCRWAQRRKRDCPVCKNRDEYA